MIEIRGDLDPARRLLSQEESPLRSALVDRVAERFFDWVADLPASERFHHARPFGLFDHSLEVANLALSRAQADGFAADDDPDPDGNMGGMARRRRYAVWFWGLTHDIGKIAEFMVRAPGGKTWNPYAESLGTFYSREGRSHCRWEWRPGRSREDSRRLSLPFRARLLTAEAALYLGAEILGDLLGDVAYLGERFRRLVHEADYLSVRRSWDSEMPS